MTITLEIIDWDSQTKLPSDQKKLEVSAERLLEHVFRIATPPQKEKVQDQ